MKISPSQIKTARTCLRKWGFKLLDGLKEPTTAAQEKGTLGHTRIEHYQRNSQHPGDDEMGKLVQQAMRPGYLPMPHPGALIEYEMNIDLGNGDVFHGYSDLIMPPEADEAQQGVLPMPAVFDWKFTSSLRWAMTEADLTKDAQGVGYSKGAFDRWPGSPGVKNRWLYFDHRAGKVRPVRVVRTASQLSEQWEELAAEARGLLTLRKRGARAVDLKGNPEACGDYGGCPFAPHCDVPKRSSAAFFGSRKQFTISEKSVKEATSSGAPALESEKHMAISLKDKLDLLKAGKNGATAPATTEAAPPAQAVAPVATPPGAPVGTGAIAALQAAKGFTGVNPPAAAPAATPTPAPAAAAAAPAPGKMSLKDRIAGKKAAEAPPVEAQAAPPAPAAPVATPQPATQASAPPVGAGVAPTIEETAANLAAALTPEAPKAEEPAAVKKLRRRITPSDAPPDTSPSAGPPSAAPRTTMSELSVLFNAVIMKHPDTTARPVMLIDLLAPLMREVADGAQKAHWSLIQFGEGKALLAHAFDKWLEKSKWKGTILVPDGSAEAFAVREVLIAHADVVVGGLS